MNWIIENREWLFGGVAIAVPIAIITWIFMKNGKVTKQKQKSGKNSINIQAGKNVNIGKENEKK